MHVASKSCEMFWSCGTADLNLSFETLQAMEDHKEFLAARESIPAEKRLRANLTDLFLSGDVSGKRARSLYQDANSAKAVG